MKIFSIIFVITAFLISAPDISSAEQDEDIQIYQDVTIIQLNLPMGKHYIKDSKGRGSIVYSTGSSTLRQDKEKKQEEEYKNAWEMLKSIIIDTRNYEESN